MQILMDVYSIIIVYVRIKNHKKLTYKAKNITYLVAQIVISMGGEFWIILYVKSL